MRSTQPTEGQGFWPAEQLRAERKARARGALAPKQSSRRALHWVRIT